jgi:hypothetical protein
VRAAQGVQRKIDLRVVDAHIGIVRKSQADGVVERENEFAADDMILQALRCRERRGGLLPDANS